MVNKRKSGTEMKNGKHFTEKRWLRNYHKINTGQ